MKNKQKKRIDFFVRKEQSKKDNRAYKHDPMIIISIVVLVLLLGFAAFLIFDTARMENKIVEGEAMLQDPQILQFYEQTEDLDQRENAYLSIKESLANLDSITATYPNVDKDFFDYLLLGNDPGLVISNLNYDGASGQLSFRVLASGYSGWNNFITKMENSSYVTGFNYSGYEKDIENNTYSSGFTVQLVKRDKELAEGEGE